MIARKKGAAAVEKGGPASRSTTSRQSPAGCGEELGLSFAPASKRLYNSMRRAQGGGSPRCSTGIEANMMRRIIDAEKLSKPYRIRHAT